MPNLLLPENQYRFRNRAGEVLDQSELLEAIGSAVWINPLIPHGRWRAYRLLACHYDHDTKLTRAVVEPFDEYGETVRTERERILIGSCGHWNPMGIGFALLMMCDD